MKVEWADEKALGILKGKVQSVGFSMDEAYKDASEDILKKILGEDKNEFSSDDNDDFDADNQNANEEEDDDVFCTSRRHVRNVAQISSAEDKRWCIIYKLFSFL